MPLIRRAVPEDAERLASFAARVYSEAFAADTPADDLDLHLRLSFRAELQEAEIRDEGMTTIIAEDEGGLAGYFQLRDQPAPDCVVADRPLELRRFYVDRPWQGRGLAQELMDAAVREAQCRGASALWLSTWVKNGRARAFYLKAGFHIVGVQPFVVGTDVQTDHILVREIDRDPARDE